MDRYGDFEERFGKYKKEEAEKRKQANTLSNLRLASFLLGTALSILLFIRSGPAAGTVSVLVSLAVFIYLILLHKRISREQAVLECKAEINRMYMERLRSGWTAFGDNGAEFADKDHPYTGDLDIFGPNSLFQWISTANTRYGRLALRRLLAEPDKSPDSVRSRQNAVKELASRLDFCQKLQCEGMMAKGVSDDPEKLIGYAEGKNLRMRSKKLINIFYLLPFVTVLSFVLWSLGAPVPMFAPVLLLTLQMVIFAASFKKNSEIFAAAYGMRKHLGAYARLLELIENEEFGDSRLKKLRNRLFTGDGPASASLKRLESIVNAVDLKYSTVLYFLLNIAFLWDYHCAFAMEEWKEKYGGYIRQWLETVGDIEALSSLAVPGHLHPEWVFPVIREGRLLFDAVKVGHPLIREDECVRNDFRLDRGACVITGSNMSGKTTLLRTVGINLVLAYAGAPVFAERLECGVMDIFTSMRVHDDLNSGISTFYAELLRIKRIIDFSHRKLPMIYLIDEIFMGTNSPDRITGARSVLKNLSRDWIIGLISTHDFELCELEQENRIFIKNYHFEEQYVNNEIRFDYRLRPGRSTTANARYLMKMIGIELEN